MRLQSHRKRYCYDLTGYDSYFSSAMPEIQDVLREALRDENFLFLIAINEAVCNAARYSVEGHERAQIHLELVVTEEDVTASISCLTQPFNAEAYRQELWRMAERDEMRSMAWSDYTGTSARSRGFWMMLMAVDFLCVDVNGDKVTLCASRPWDDGMVTKEIGILAERFFVEKDGVIY